METSSTVRSLRAIPVALVKGFSEWQTLLVLLWLTLLCAAIAVGPDLFGLFKYYSHAPLSDGRPLLSPELLLGAGQSFPSGTAPLSGHNVALLVGLLLTPFLTGGVVWRAWTVDRFRLSDFLAESTRMFGRVVRTLLWSFPLFVGCAGVVAGATAILHAVHRDSAFTVSGVSWLVDRPLTGWAVAHLVLCGLLWALWRLTLDTSRVLVLVEELRQTRWAVWRAFRLVVRSPGAWFAYVVLGAVELLAVVLMIRLHGALPEGNTALAWLALLVAQLVVLVRSGFQVSTTAFAADLVRRTRAAAATAPLGFSGTSGSEIVAPSPGVTVGAPDAAPSEAEPFELLSSKEPPRTGSTSEMPLVDADLVEEDPRGGGSGKH